MVEFIQQNLIACIVVAIAIIVLCVIAVMLAISFAKRTGRDEIEKLVANIPVTYEDDVAVTESCDTARKCKNADLKWVREQAFDWQEITKDIEKEGTNMAKENVKNDAQKKPAVKKTATKVATATEKIKATVAKQVKPTKKAVGKWIIREKSEGEFVSYLHANNGEIILTSEIYASVDGAKKGVATIKKSIDSDSFQLYCDKNRNYYFKLKNASNRFLCVGETYPTKASCLSAIESVKRFADSPLAEEIEKDLTVIKYSVPKSKSVDKKTTYTGKWVIVNVEDMYIAQLFASNGELLLSSESYMTQTSAKSAIETITTNGLAGNFIIDVDKKGRYFFKLRNAQKSTLCIGETYSEQAKCESAIESVRRFLVTAKVEV